MDLTNLRTEFVTAVEPPDATTARAEDRTPKPVLWVIGIFAGFLIMSAFRSR